MATAGSDVLNRLIDAGALKTGHFVLSSGRHSDRYMEKFDLLRNPRATEEICHGFLTAFADQHIDVVVGPTTGGIILAFDVARQLGVAAAYAERSSGDSAEREFRRGTRFEQGSRVLVVDDILTTGGSVRETLRALEPHPVEVVGIGVLLDRSTSPLEFAAPLVALARLEVETWPPGDCPLCARGDVVTKPGTTPGVVNPDQEPSPT